MASRSQQCRTPVKADRRGDQLKSAVKSPTMASPEVKARLLEMRKAAARLAAATLIQPLQLDMPARDAACDTASDNDEQGGSTSDTASEATTPLDEVASMTVNNDKHNHLRVQEIAYGKATLDQLIVEAKTSGRLNLASRDLEAMPAEIFMQLLPVGSSLLPVARGIHYSGPAVANLDFSASINRRHVSGPKWWEFTDLVYLNLSYNALHTLDNALGGFEALRDLDLRANSLSELPSSLEGLVNLTTLNISRNHFTCIPPQCKAMTSLTHLTISHNRLDGDQQLDSVASLRNLLELDVSHNTITTLVSPAATIGDIDVVNRLQALRKLDVSYNCFSDIASVVEPLRGRAVRLQGSSMVTDVAIPIITSDAAVVIVVDIGNNPLKQANPAALDEGGVSHGHRSQSATSSSQPALLERATHLLGRLERRLAACEENQPSIASLMALNAAIGIFLDAEEQKQQHSRMNTPSDRPSIPVGGTPRRNRQTNYAWDAL